MQSRDHSPQGSRLPGAAPVSPGREDSLSGTTSTLHRQGTSKEDTEEAVIAVPARQVTPPDAGPAFRSSPVLGGDRTPPNRYTPPGTASGAASQPVGAFPAPVPTSYAPAVAPSGSWASQSQPAGQTILDRSPADSPFKTQAPRPDPNPFSAGGSGYSAAPLAAAGGPGGPAAAAAAADSAADGPRSIGAQKTLAPQVPSKQQSQSDFCDTDSHLEALNWRELALQDEILDRRIAVMENLLLSEEERQRLIREEKEAMKPPAPYTGHQTFEEKFIPTAMNNYYVDRTCISRREIQLAHLTDTLEDHAYIFWLAGFERAERQQYWSSVEKHMMHDFSVSARHD